MFQIKKMIFILFIYFLIIHGLFKSRYNLRAPCKNCINTNYAVLDLLPFMIFMFMTHGTKYFNLEA